MPTAGELQIVIEAQDRASAQLRQIGQEVQRLERQVEGVHRSTRAGGGLLGGLSFGAGFQAAQQAFAGLQGVIDAIGDSIVTQNSRLEQVTASYEALTGSASRAADMLQVVRQEAGRGFDLGQLQEAGRSLIAAAGGSLDTFRQLIDLSEQLAATDPAQGIQSAAFAIREALSGDFTSLIERFEASRAAIARWREEGLPNIEVVARAIEQLGGSRAAVDRLGQTFQARTTAVRNFADELRGLLGAGVFERISDAFGRMVRLIQDHGDQLRRMAADLGQAIGAILQGALNALAPVAQRVLDAFAPGLWDQITASWNRLAPEVQRTTQALQEAAPAAQTLERRLAEIGVGAAERQLEADRLRSAYDEQLRPLERQIELLQNSADLQRIAAGLASNRAATERQRLQAELAALDRAGGARDPNEEGLTTRQRAIALAAQERRLQLEQLNLTEQQRPALQSLEQRRDALRRQQEEALAPLQRQLDVYRQQAAELNLQRQRAELLAQDLEKAAEAQRKARQAAGDGDDPAEQARRIEAARQRGEDLARSWLDGWTKWIDQGGGTVWGALLKTLEDWWTATGRPAAIRIGAELGVAVGAAAGYALQATLGPQLKTLQTLEQAVAGLQERLGVVQQAAGRVAVGAGVQPTVNPGVDLGRVNPFAGTGGGGSGGSTVNVNIAPGGVTVESTGATSEDLRRARDETIRAITAAFAASAATTDPGASPNLAGAGRAP